MRLVAWNARRGKFDHKVKLIEHLQANVAVIPEIAAPSSESPHILWFGENRNQGMAVIAKAPFTLRRLPELPDTPKYFAPIAVEGPISFTLFAVWTLGRKPFPYVEGASMAIDMYSEEFRGKPVVLLGDFNSNAIWDKGHPKSLNHSAMVQRLERTNLVSAYHHHRQLEHGSEPKIDHTFYLYGHEDKSFHIDYCFLPRSWADRVENVEVGGYGEWREHSDHRPLVVTIRNED